MKSALAGMSLHITDTSNLEETSCTVLYEPLQEYSLAKRRPVIPCQGLLLQLGAAVEALPHQYLRDSVQMWANS